MNSNPLRKPPDERLRFLAETVLSEADLLLSTDGRLFSVPMTTERAASLRTDQDLAESDGRGLRRDITRTAGLREALLSRHK